MEVHFTTKLEEYYRKFVDLQEKLRKSEEQRLLLEMRFGEMAQVARDEEQAHYRKLRAQYKRFVEEDKKRQDRNERIIRNLERVETRIAMLSAKTERINILRKQYQSYLLRIAGSKPDKKSTLVNRGFKQGLYADEEENKEISLKSSNLKSCYENDEKIEILDKYLESISSEKCKDKLGLQKKKDESNNATAIADDIMQSIYSRYYNKSDLSPEKISTDNQKPSQPTVSVSSKEAKLSVPELVVNSFTDGDAWQDKSLDEAKLHVQNDPAYLEDFTKTSDAPKSTNDVEFNYLKQLSNDDPNNKLQSEQTNASKSVDSDRYSSAAKEFVDPTDKELKPASNEGMVDKMKSDGFKTSTEIDFSNYDENIQKPQVHKDPNYMDELSKYSEQPKEEQSDHSNTMKQNQYTNLNSGMHEYVKDSNQYALNPNQFAVESDQYGHDTGQYEQPNMYSQDPNDYIEDPSQYPMQPEQYSQDVNQYEQVDPNLYVDLQEETNQYAQDLNQYVQDPNQFDAQYCQDPNQYVEESNQFGQDAYQYAEETRTLEAADLNQNSQYQIDNQNMQGSSQYIGEPSQYSVPSTTQEPNQYSQEQNLVVEEPNQYSADPIQYDEIPEQQAEGGPSQYDGENQHQPTEEQNKDGFYLDNPTNDPLIEQIDAQPHDPSNQEQMYDQSQYLQYEQENLAGYDEYGQPLMYDQHGQIVQPQYDDQGQMIPQYDENEQLIIYYDHSGNPYGYGDPGQMYEYGDDQGEQRLGEETKTEDEPMVKILDILDTDTETSKYDTTS